MQFKTTPPKYAWSALGLALALPLFVGCGNDAPTTDADENTGGSDNAQGSDGSMNPDGDDGSMNPDGDDGSMNPDGDDGSPGELAEITIGGTLMGVLGTGLTLELNGETQLQLSEDGSFEFDEAITEGDSFAVTVSSQPSGPVQECDVMGGTGTANSKDVTTVVVNCGAAMYTLGGSVADLAGTGLELSAGAGNVAQVEANGSFAFPGLFEEGDEFEVTVQAQPSALSQTCELSGATGTFGAANIDAVSVTCVTNSFAVEPTVSGLAGTGLVLELNSNEDLDIAADGANAFASSLLDGSAYSVTVKTQPMSPAQVCSITSGDGVVAGEVVSDVQVDCVTDSYAIGGTVTGLLGSGLTLQNNGGDDLMVAADGVFQFVTSVDTESDYEVAVATQPGGPSQSCVVTGGSGTVAAGDVSSVSVNCTTNMYTAGGNVTGLAGTGLVLQNKGGDDLEINANGAFAFSAEDDLSAYAVTVSAHPSGPTQTCSVTSGAGNLAGANVTAVEVDCVTSSFSVGGSLSGLVSGSVVLTNNGGDDLALGENGEFSFSTPVLSGATYDVAVKSSPSGTACTVTNGSQAVGGVDVTNVAVTCFSAEHNFDGGDAPGWTEGSGSYAISYPAGANGTTSSIQLTGTGGHHEGLTYSFPSCQMESLSVWIQAGDSTGARAYLTVGDDNTDSNNGILFQYANSSGDWRAVSSPSSSFAPVVANEWVHFEYTFDWLNKTIDIYMNNVLAVDDIPFRAQSDEVTQINFYNYSAGATTLYDELDFTCAP